MSGLVIAYPLRGLDPTGASIVVGALFKARIVRGINSAPTSMAIVAGAHLMRDSRVALISTLYSLKAQQSA